MIGNWFAALALALVVSISTLDAQMVMSNEQLVSTTFVVGWDHVPTSCQGIGCTAKPVPIFKPIHVACPAAIGKTCTLNILLDGRTYINGCTVDCYAGDLGTYQFLVDGVAPRPGPTDAGGFYTFSIYSAGFNGGYQSRVSSLASVLGRVRNSGSKDHQIDINVACKDVSTLGNCEAIAYGRTLRIDVFEP